MTDTELTEQLLKLRADIKDVAGNNEERELLALRQLLGSYRQETLHWAERRSAALPSLAEQARAERWKAVPQWVLATIALLTIAGGITHVTAGHADSNLDAVEHSQPVSSTSSSSAEIAADNRLLSSIDQELSYHGASSVDALHLQDVRAEGRDAASGELN